MTNTMRLRFRKGEKLKYISHLDLHRTFARALRRAGIKIKYSNGFNPHPKLVFGLTLSVGCEGEYEALDVTLCDENLGQNGEYALKPEEFVEKLNKVLPEDLEAIDAYYAQRPFKEIAFSGYDFSLGSSISAQEALDALSGEIRLVKRSKSGEKEVDISEMISSVNVECSKGETFVNAVITAANENYLNPEYIVKALKLKTGKSIESYGIRRVSILDKELENFI